MAQRPPPRFPAAVVAVDAAAAVVLDLSADTFVLFTVLWIACPQGWTGVKTAAVVVALPLPALAGGWLGGRGVDRFGPKPMMIGQALLRVGCLAALAAGGMVLYAKRPHRLRGSGRAAGGHDRGGEGPAGPGSHAAGGGRFVRAVARPGLLLAGHIH